LYSILSDLVLPSGIGSLLAACGLLCLLWPRTRRIAVGLLTSAALVLLTFSSGTVASLLLGPLEYPEPAPGYNSLPGQARQIVVLTGWAIDDRQVPFGYRMNSLSAHRILTAMELAHDCHDCAVIVTGDARTARIMGQAMRQLGLPADRLHLEEQSHSTAETARHLVPLVGTEPFYLVTSAAHMRRSMESLETQGLKAIAVPTDFRVGKGGNAPLPWPSSSWLQASDAAAHEYFGILWYRLTGRINDKPARTASEPQRTTDGEYALLK
jgi:uncharacterized SAM-binding protein YcdF (DUF218 family)